MGKRTTLADALHQAGELDEAAALFDEAEVLQKQRQPSLPRLYSLAGYRYCDLLLGQRAYEEVQERAAQTLQNERQGWYSLLSIALDHLSLGRAAARQEPGFFKKPGSYGEATQHLQRAVDGLRQSGNQDDLPRGLLARAALYRSTGEFERALRDLEEALRIAARGGMKLHECDAHLEYARLYLASGNLSGLTPAEHLSAAEALIAETGYHRRSGDAEQLAAQLGSEA